MRSDREQHPDGVDAAGPDPAAVIAKAHARVVRHGHDANGAQRWAVVTGSRRRKAESTLVAFATEALARAYAERLNEKTEAGAIFEPVGSPVTLAQLLERWLGAMRRRGRARASTLSTYRYQIKAICKSIGGALLRPGGARDEKSILSRVMVVGHAQATADNGSPATARGHLAILRMTLGLAVKKQWWFGDPATLCQVDLAEPPAKHWLSREEVAAVIAAVDRYESGWKNVPPPGLGIAVRLAVFAGPREGEVATRQWRDLDARSGMLHICAKSGLGWTWRPKNGRPRWIPVGDELMTALKRWRLRLGNPGDDAWMVPAQDGERRRDPSWYNEALHRACRDAGIPEVTFHELRHTFATQALEAGAPLVQVSRILGHRSVDYTARQYAHVTDRGLRDAANLMAEHVRESGRKAGNGASNNPSNEQQFADGPARIQ